MASEVTTMTRKRRKFSKEFKLETVKLVKEGPRGDEDGRGRQVDGHARRNEDGSFRRRSSRPQGRDGSTGVGCARQGDC